MRTVILSQWYREEGYPLWTYRIWREALRKFAPGVPIVIVHNGGPTDPPYGDVEVVPAVEMEPHGRGTPQHYRNCWRSMAHGWSRLADAGITCAPFIGQNLVVGAQFAEECERLLADNDVLYNTGCLNPGWAFTEYMAVNPMACRSVFDRRLDHGHLEGRVVEWFSGLRRAPFPGLWKHRDAPLLDTDTAFFHGSHEELRRFAELRGIPC